MHTKRVGVDCLEIEKRNNDALFQASIAKACYVQYLL